MRQLQTGDPEVISKRRSQFHSRPAGSLGTQHHRHHYEDCILPPDVASPLDRLKQQAAAQTAEPAPLPSCETLPCPQPRGAKLFTRPLSVDALELPFRDETFGSRAGEFYRQLKTHILGRFLGSRRSTIRAG